MELPQVGVKLTLKTGLFLECTNLTVLAPFKLMVQPIILLLMKEMLASVPQQIIVLVMKDQYLMKKLEFLP